jgi:hypothetical protein
MALIFSCALIALCTLVRLVGHRVHDAEERRSRRQWRVMCEALGLEDLADDADEPSTASPALSPAPPADETMLTEVAR